jgi:phosphatidylinositol alpha-mannosyltransferase
MRLRIAVVTQAYHQAVGGVTEHVAGTARALTRRGHRVTVVTASFGKRVAGRDGAESKLGIDVVRLGRNMVVPFNGAENNVTVGWDLGRRLADLLAPGGRPAFDVVHVHCPISPVLPILAIHVAGRAGVPIVGTFHTAADTDGWVRAFRRPLQRFVARLDRAIAVSEAAREYAARHFPIDPVIVPNGVDLDRFRPGVPRLARFDDDTPNLLFVGRFDPRKGIPELIRAAERLAHAGVRFRLVLVGDGRLRAEAERLARGALRGRVVFEGRVEHEHLPAYYASADLFCSPARGGESFGMVLLEAMALGVPVIATDLPGHRSVVTDGVEGILVPRRDVGALAGAMARLLGDAEERRRLGANGLARAAHFGWDAIAARLEDLYREAGVARAAGSRDGDNPEGPARPAGPTAALETVEA